MNGAGEEEELKPQDIRWFENCSDGREGRNAEEGPVSTNGGVYVPPSTVSLESLRVDTPFFFENEKKLLLLESRLGRRLSVSESGGVADCIGVLAEVAVDGGTGSKVGEVGFE